MLSYTQLRAQIEETVRGLLALGVGHSHRVAIVLSNGPAMAAAFLSGK